MNISVQLFVVKWKMIMAAIIVLLAGKLAVMVAAGQMFGLSRMASLRAGEHGILNTTCTNKAC
jgi:hypothetical protein